MGDIKKYEKKISKEQADFLARLGDIGIEEILGGKGSISYRLLYDLCDMTFTEEFQQEFDLIYVDELPLSRFAEAVMFIVNWFPDDTILAVSEVCEDMFSEYIDKFFDELPNAAGRRGEVRKTPHGRGDKTDLKGSRAYQQLMEDFINAVCTSSEGSD